MKKYLSIIIFAWAMMWPAGAAAQAGLNINRVFSDHYRSMKGATETLVVRDKLASVNLDTYHSMTLTGHPELAAEIERMVSADGRNALSKEVKYHSGRIYYGLYHLKGSRAGVSRYILYLNGHLKGDNRIILLFLEGRATTEPVKKLLK